MANTFFDKWVDNRNVISEITDAERDQIDDNIAAGEKEYERLSSVYER